MREILSLSFREISRLRQRFSGGISPLAVLILIGLVGLSVYAFRDVNLIGAGLYRVAVSGDVPLLDDERFSVVPVSEEEGRELLSSGEVDVWIDGDQVYAQEQNQKAQYAVRALRMTLGEKELERIGKEYDEDRAFPLLVSVQYLDPAAVLVEEGASMPMAQETIIPSLTPPPAPFTQVLIALIYILPVTFISIFFTGSFMDEKINRRLVILLSTPVTPLQIIVGKMIPYFIFATAATALIALLTHVSLWRALAIYTPTTLFIFAIYLMVPMFYRTYKDTTFISMMVTTLTTAYLVFPAMFAGTNELAYLSPLTLAVNMYRGESFGWREYLFPSLPMVVTFCLAVYVSTRLLNEEFLMGYRPIVRKIFDAVFLSLNRNRPYLSVLLLSALVIPIVYVLQLILLAIATNLPVNVMLATVLLASVLIEEVVKSIGIVALAERGVVRSAIGIVGLAFLSALGFLAGEKLLLFTSISAVSNLPLSGMIFSTGSLLLVPLAAHFVFTTIVSFLTIKAKIPYALALAIGAIFHALYNWALLGGM